MCCLALSWPHSLELSLEVEIKILKEQLSKSEASPTIILVWEYVVDEHFPRLPFVT